MEDHQGQAGAATWGPSIFLLAVGGYELETLH